MKGPQPNSSELELVSRGVFQTITNSTRYLNPAASLQASSQMVIKKGVPNVQSSDQKQERRKKNERKATTDC